MSEVPLSSSRHDARHYMYTPLPSISVLSVPVYFRETFSRELCSLGASHVHPHTRMLPFPQIRPSRPPTSSFISLISWFAVWS